MRIHVLQHVPYEGPGSIARWAEKNEYLLTLTRFYAGDSLPDQDSYDMLLILGGPMGVNDTKKVPWLKEEKHFISEAIEQGKMVLGICLGAQLVANVLGAKIKKNEHREIGWYPITATPNAMVLGLPQQFQAFHWHGDTFGLPDGAIPIGTSDGCENQGFIYQDRVVALQFHLETTPEAAKELIDACAHEIDDGPHCQPAEAMLVDLELFSEANQRMEQIMSYMLSQMETDWYMG
ncbi:type 1 glutamine amidotransferase [Oceanospirillum beijerinckii]|uniref:type 1 glutamine amidotransferase n=1 Tax=Oceanospirillum beijerinckii TaxID=64976 RepID=UPI0004235455|nr:type 1 glutamine amidotransferase [Oceanospirillum beijerinckii]